MVMKRSWHELRLDAATWCGSSYCEKCSAL